MSSNPTAERCHLWLAAALGQSEKRDEAAAELEQVLRLNPELSIARLAEMFPFRDPADLELFLDGLRKAGLWASDAGESGPTLAPYRPAPR